MYFDDDLEAGFSGGDYPSECPMCGSNVELDTNQDGDYYVSDIICTNGKCNYKLEFNREHKDDLEKDYYEFITVSEEDEEED